MKKIIITAALAVLSLSAFAQKVAYVDSQELFQLMPEMDKVRTQMDAIVKENQDVVKSMYDEYQTKVQAYQNNAASWMASVKESKEKEIMELENRIQETQQSMQQEMQTIQTNLTAPVMKKCTDAIQAAGKAGGYLFVFDKSSMLYFDETQAVDLTPSLRKTLGIAEGRTLETLQKELQAKAQQAQ